MIVAIALGPYDQRLCEGLRQAGFDAVVRFDAHGITAEMILPAMPDVVLMDLGDPDDETFANTLALVRKLDCPTVLFVNRTERARTDAAIEAGVSIYVVDGFKAERLGAVVEVAIARHHARARILSALAAKDKGRADRAVIDQAKTILMNRDGMTEDMAYTALRKVAMNQNRRLVEVAQLVIDTAGIQQPRVPIK